MSNTKLNKNQTGNGIWTQDSLVAGSGISITQVPQPVIDANTLGVWHFENNLDNAVAESVVGPITSSGTWTFSNDVKKFNAYSASFSGSTIQMFPSYASTIRQLSSVTIDFWFKTPSATGGDNRVLYCETGSLMISNNTLTIVKNGEAPIEISAQEATWYHAAYEYVNSSCYIYIDGELKTTKSVNMDNRYLFLTSGSNISKCMFLDELRLSNVARYQGQNFTPFNQPYTAGGTTQYAINNTKSNELPSQTGNSGKYLTTDGTNASWAAVSSLQNLATGSNALTLIGQASTKSNSINLGYYSYVSKDDAIAIGSYTYATGDKSIAIGPASSSLNTNTQASATDSIAIGKYARASASSAVQLGTGTNSTASTFQVFSTTLLDANNKVPLATLPIVQCTQAQYDALVSGGTVDSNTLYIITPAS